MPEAAMPDESNRSERLLPDCVPDELSQEEQGGARTDSTVVIEEDVSAHELALLAGEEGKIAVAEVIDAGPFTDALLPALMFLDQETLRELAPIADLRKQLREEYHYFSVRMPPLLESEQVFEQGEAPEVVSGAQAWEVDSEDRVPGWKDLLSRLCSPVVRTIGALQGLRSRETMLSEELPPEPSEKQKFLERIEAHPEILDIYLENIKELAEQFKAAFSAEPGRYGYAALHEIRNFVYRQAMDLSSIGFGIKGNEELKERFEKLKDDGLEPIQKEIAQLLAESAYYEWMVEAVSITPERDALSSFGFEFSRHVTTHFESHNSATIDDREVESFGRIIDFLRHMKRFEKAPERDGFLSSRFDGFRGADFCYDVMLQLSHMSSRWVLFEPKLRPVIRPLLEEAREEYLATAGTPLSEVVKNDSSHTHLAMFVESALLYERETLRTMALEDGSLASLIAISFGWGSETCVERTGQAAGELLRRVATEIRERLLKEPFSNPKHIEFALHRAMEIGGWSPEEQDTSVMARTLERIGTRDHRQYALANRYFLRGADDEQFKLWLEAVTHHESEMRKYQHSAPVSTLLMHGVEHELLKHYIGNIGNEFAEAPLKDLFGKFQREEALHLLRICGEDIRGLTVLARVYQSGEGWQPGNLSPEEVLAAENLTPLVEKLRDNFKHKIQPLVTGTFQARDSHIEHVSEGELRDYCQQCAVRIEEQIFSVVDEMFALESALTPEKLEEMCMSPDFASVLFGVRDTQMLLPPTEPESFVVDTAAQELLKLFPHGMFLSAAHQDPQPELHEKREQVQTRLFEAVPKWISDLERKSPHEIQQELRTNFSLREDLWALVNSPRFANEVLDGILRDAQVSPGEIEIRVAAKSDSATWTLPPERSHIFRKDAALLVVDYQGKQTASPLWMGQDRETLILDHMPVPSSIEEASEERVRSAVKDFVSRYASREPGRYLCSADRAPRFNRVVLGPVYSGQSVRNLEECEPVAPIGDSPETAGKGLGREAEGQYSQRVFWKKE